MSTGIKLACLDCRECVYIGTNNTELVEHPDKAGKFIWKHAGHDLRTVAEYDNDSYYDCNTLSNGD